MAKTRAVVDVIGSDDLPGKLVHQVVFFVVHFAEERTPTLSGP
jgi:hypothetical protein